MPARLRLLVATIWAGSLWTVGYLVAPTLFITLDDRVLAGTIAGRLFRVEAWLCVACAIVLGILVRYFSPDLERKQIRSIAWLIAGMLACTLIGYFGLQPFMAALREAAGPAGVMDSDAKLQFGLLHGASSAIYLVQSLLGVALVVKAR
ncbi:DUF4149 domain-containing protein [Noviherbaspirillum saxi]|uniref:DUF4149 domain-containing protein n=1 Tax=Noviherbaspirillum saxi TaxID=2320863 RepID=A0A3A3FV48_9BURK|nr:DUF4149 domain-containing protein [Noviherbaspirillum saxi]RJG00073.1 DUF4149 domain-containing protein [Noviherbaspirillum saxi]